jgi:hypothetical protein
VSPVYASRFVSLRLNDRSVTTAKAAVRSAIAVSEAISGHSTCGLARLGLRLLSGLLLHQVLVERVDVGLDAVDIRLRTQGLTNLTAEMSAVTPERKAA